MKRIIFAIAVALFSAAPIVSAQTKDTPQPPSKAQPPARKPGMAAEVEKRANAPAVTTPAPNTYNAKLGAVYEVEQAIARLKAVNAAPALIAQSEATLAALRADLAATPKPADPFNLPK